jgi:hypothetical protein
MGEKDPVDPIMRDMVSVKFLNLLFQMYGSKVVLEIRVQDDLFSLGINRFRLPSRLPNLWKFLVLLELDEQLVDPLTTDLEITSNLYNRLPFQPLLDYSRDVSI